MLRVADGWRVEPGPLGLQLLPPGDSDGESYLLSSASADGVEGADDPRLLAHLDVSLREMVPGLGLPEAPVPCGDGIEVQWPATNVATGARLLAVAIVQVARGQLHAMVGMGERARVEARLPALAEMLMPLGVEPELDGEPAPGPDDDR